MSIICSFPGAAGHRQEAVLRELAADGEELAAASFGFDHVGADGPGLVMHVDAVDHVLHVLVAGVELDGGVDVPFDDLAVEEQRGEGVAAAVVGGVQGPRPISTSATMLLLMSSSLPSRKSRTLARFDDRGGGRELAGADEVFAVRAGIDAVGFLGTGT